MHLKKHDPDFQPRRVQGDYGTPSMPCLKRLSTSAADLMRSRAKPLATVAKAAIAVSLAIDRCANHHMDHKPNGEFPVKSIATPIAVPGLKAFPSTTWAWPGNPA